jgi:hypothetical protein
VDVIVLEKIYLLKRAEPSTAATAITNNDPV